MPATGSRQWRSEPSLSSRGLPHSWEEGVSLSFYLGAMMILSSILVRPAQVLGWGSGLVIRTFGPSPSEGRNTSKPACRNTYWEVISLRHRPSGGKQRKREPPHPRPGCKRAGSDGLARQDRCGAGHPPGEWLLPKPCMMVRVANQGELFRKCCSALFLT